MPVKKESLTLDTHNWKSFVYTQIFEMKKGKRATKAALSHGTTPFIGAIDLNNGLKEYGDLPPMLTGNVITVPYNGNGVGEAFYQPAPFWATDDVNVLVPK